jgi:hypothetical protein
MSSKPPQKRALDAVLARAAEDRQFRTWLLEDPKTAIQKTFGITIPQSFRIKFIEKSADLDSLVVLPDFHGTDHELSERDLDAVSGGVDADAWADPVEASWAEPLPDPPPEV